MLSTIPALRRLKETVFAIERGVAVVLEASQRRLTFLHNEGRGTKVRVRFAQIDDIDTACLRLRHRRIHVCEHVSGYVERTLGKMVRSRTHCDCVLSEMLEATVRVSEIPVHYD